MCEDLLLVIGLKTAQAFASKAFGGLVISWVNQVLLAKF